MLCPAPGSLYLLFLLPGDFSPSWLTIIHPSDFSSNTASAGKLSLTNHCTLYLHCVTFLYGSYTVCNYSFSFMTFDWCLSLAQDSRNRNHILLFLKYAYWFVRERKGERERERERDWLHICTPTRDWTQNLGMCPDWESNLQPFGVRDDAPTNWDTLASVRRCFFLFIIIFSVSIIMPGL